MYRFSLHGQEVSCDSVVELLAALSGGDVEPTSSTQRARKRETKRGRPRLSAKARKSIGDASKKLWAQSRKYAKRTGMSVRAARDYLTEHPQVRDKIRV